MPGSAVHWIWRTWLRAGQVGHVSPGRPWTSDQRQRQRALFPNAEGSLPCQPSELGARKASCVTDSRSPPPALPPPHVSPAPVPAPFPALCLASTAVLFSVGPQSSQIPLHALVLRSFIAGADERRARRPASLVSTDGSSARSTPRVTLSPEPISTQQLSPGRTRARSGNHPTCNCCGGSSSSRARNTA